MRASEARRRRAAIAADRMAYEALLNLALDMGDCDQSEVNMFNNVIRDKKESEARLAQIEAGAQS